MAVKIGKREKIIIGLIIGIAAIGAVHFFIYQSKQNQFRAAKAEFDAKKTQADGLASVNVNDRQFFDAYKQQTAADERLLWKAVLDMDLIVPIYFSIADPQPTEPEEKTPEAMSAYKEAMDAYKRRTDPVQIAAEAVLTERFERLMNMKRAYEGGQPWKTDAITQGQSVTNVLKMPFMAEGVPDATGLPQNGWNLPVELSQNLSPGAGLWDEVSALYGKWSVLNVMPEESEDYMKVNYEYIDQLKKMGLNMDVFPAISENLSPYLPEFIKLLHARKVWQQRKDGETPRVGMSQELSLDLLKSMYDVRLPRIMEPEHAPQMLNLDRQLWALERVLPMARRSMIEEIQIVKLDKVKPIGTADPAAIAAAKKPAVVSAAATPRSLLNSTNTGGANPAPRLLTTTGSGTAMQPSNTQKASVAWLGAPGIGLASHIYMRYVATNENSMRFLHSLITDLHNFRIDSLTVYSMDNQKITVDLWFDVPIALFQISLLSDGNLVDSHGKPFTQVGQEMMAEWRKTQSADPFEVQSVVQKALADAGLPADALEKLETPPPATPEPVAAVPGMPSMPGMPAAPEAPPAEAPSEDGLPIPAE